MGSKSRGARTVKTRLELIEDVEGRDRTAVRRLVVRERCLPQYCILARQCMQEVTGFEEIPKQPRLFSRQMTN